MKCNFNLLLFSVLLMTACETAPKMPVMGDREVFDVAVEEISGICLNSDKTALLAVGDQGVVKQVSFTGEVTHILDYDADMEDVTLDPNTGDMYIADEWHQGVLKLDSPEYQNCNMQFYVQEAIDDQYKNSGLEGISYYKDDIFFVGSQKGSNLWQYKKDGTVLSKVSLSEFACEIAGLCYDSVADWLWVIDSKSVKIYICKIDGQLLATYDLEDVKNAESICVDRDRNCVWVGSDEDSPKLYKYSFEF